MPIEGELIVRLDCDGRRIRRVTVRSTRPAIAARVLTGRTAVDAAAIVPSLFSLCGGAQRAAAACALVAAGATELDADPASHRPVVMLEAVQDTFRQLLVDWPNALGAAPCTTPVAEARSVIAAATRLPDGGPRRLDADAIRALGMRLSDLAAGAIFGMPVARWRELADVDALKAWCVRRGTLAAVLLGRELADDPALGRSAVALMPPVQLDALRRVIVPALRADAEFARAPTWGGAPVETGALARGRDDPLVAAVHRAFGNAVVTRMVARLAELALTIAELTRADPHAEAAPRIQGLALGNGEGLAAVETARGLLLHHARVRDGSVIGYQIVAPTEWNFHPDGALVHGLAGLEADDDRRLLAAARQAVQALDPCVASRVEVEHA